MMMMMMMMMTVMMIMMMMPMKMSKGSPNRMQKITRICPSPMPSNSPHALVMRKSPEYMP